ncbi:hypothetical protein SEPCBS119000_006719, partial [Sporothrix epigloea]
MAYAPVESRKRKSNEISGVEEAASPGSRQVITVSLPLHVLGQLAGHWRAIVNEKPDLYRFSDFKFYFSAKNLKSMWTLSAEPHSQQTVDERWQQLTSSFEAKWDLHFDQSFLRPDDIFVDIAKESTPAVVRERDGRTVKDENMTFLFRRCCLKPSASQSEVDPVWKELIGLGMNESAQKYGFGWWIPGKFDFIAWCPDEAITAHIMKRATM